MDNIIKSTPNYSGISDSAYDRNEDAEAKYKQCTNCEGSGVIYFCDECDQDASGCICINSKDMKSETCEQCDGEGEIEI